jgi:hypothetical protein
MPTTLNAEEVGYWYLRPNGLVHGDRRGEDRTEIDVVGVRFQYRREHLSNPMADDDWVQHSQRTIVVFCDAKTGAHDFNRSWSNRRRRIMESFLALVGVIPDILWDRVARELYDNGRSEPDPNLLITALLIHHDPQQQVLLRWKAAKVIQIEDALQFIHRRFKAYEAIKRSHEQWETSGHSLWQLYDRHHWSEDEFVKAGLSSIGISVADAESAKANARQSLSMSDEKQS